MGGPPASAAPAEDTLQRGASHDDHDEAEADAPGGLDLAHGRTLTIAARPGAQLLELRAPGGAVELRIHVTGDGPVLSAESVRLSLTAAEDIELRCRHFRLEACETLELASRGSARVQAAESISVRAADFLELRGKLLGLNSERPAVLESMARLYFGGDMDRCLDWLARQDSPVLEW